MTQIQTDLNLGNLQKGRNEYNRMLYQMIKYILSDKASDCGHDRRKLYPLISNISGN